MLNLNFNLNLSFNKVNIMKSYPEYCDGVGYPAPFQKQVEMYNFAFQYRTKTPRLILGARGYGKTGMNWAIIFKVKLWRSHLDWRQRLNAR